MSSFTFPYAHPAQLSASSPGPSQSAAEGQRFGLTLAELWQAQERHFPSIEVAEDRTIKNGATAFSGILNSKDSGSAPRPHGLPFESALTPTQKFSVAHRSFCNRQWAAAAISHIEAVAMRGDDQRSVVFLLKPTGEASALGDRTFVVCGSVARGVFDSINASEEQEECHSHVPCLSDVELDDVVIFGSGHKTSFERLNLRSQLTSQIANNNTTSMSNAELRVGSEVVAEGFALAGDRWEHSAWNDGAGWVGKTKDIILVDPGLPYPTDEFVLVSDRLA